MPADNVGSPIEAIPDPQTIRQRLAQLVRERALLKSLLKLSQRKQQETAAQQAPTRPGGPNHAA